jgi:hypothetical protein
MWSSLQDLLSSIPGGHNEVPEPHSLGNFDHEAPFSSEFPWEAHIPSQQSAELTVDEPLLLPQTLVRDIAELPQLVEGGASHAIQDNEVEGACPFLVIWFDTDRHVAGRDADGFAAPSLCSVPQSFTSSK